MTCTYANKMVKHYKNYQGSYSGFSFQYVIGGKHNVIFRLIFE